MTFQDLLNAGLKAYENGDFPRARTILAKAVRQNPSSAVAWLELGKILEDPVQRAHCLNEVLRLQPGNEEATMLLTRLHIALGEEARRLDSTANNILPPSVSSSEGTYEPSASLETMEDAPTVASPALSSISGVQRLGILGFLAGLIIVGIPVLVLAMRGSLDDVSYSLLRRLQGGRVSDPISQVTSIPLGPTWTPTASYTPKPPSATPSATATPSFDERWTEVSYAVMSANSYMAEEKYGEAITSWNRVISVIPEHAEAYYGRGLSYKGLMNNQRSLHEFTEYLYRALRDLDQAIALDPYPGNYYRVRAILYETMAGIEPYRVNRDYLYGVALENYQMSNALGNTFEYSERTPGFILTYIGECEEGRREANELIDMAGGQDVGYSAGLNHMLALSYMCEGQDWKALSHIDIAIAIDPIPSRRYERAVIQYSLGRLKDALKELDQLIVEQPYYTGRRYFLRALIYSQMGEFDLAEEDLMFGRSQTWGQYGLLPYAEGLLVFENGDTESAIELLKYAESTLPTKYGTILVNIHQLLENLGTSPTELQIDVDITSTPIAMPEATRTPTTIPTRLPTPTVPAVSAEDATPVAVESGTGPVSISPGDTRQFQFVFPDDFEIVSVEEMYFILNTDPEKFTYKLFLYLRNISGGQSYEILMDFDQTMVQHSPQDYYSQNLGIVAAITNAGDETILFDNMFVYIRGYDFNGNSVSIGPEPLRMATPFIITPPPTLSP